jgi:PTS system nitrogen regulatory IIA component
MPERSAHRHAKDNAMNIEDLLSPADALVEPRTLDKLQLLKELSARAAAGRQLEARLVADAILKREDLGSTGVGGGVAIPHARFRDLQKSFGVLVRLKKPIDFDAVDGRPVDIVFLLIAPESGQLNALACIARNLRDAKVVADLRQAKNGAAVYQAIAAGAPKDTNSP